MIRRMAVVLVNAIARPIDRLICSFPNTTDDDKETP